MAIIGRSVLLALSMLLAGCAGLDRRGDTAGDSVDETYGYGGWSGARDPYWSARDAYYGPYGWSAFGPYGYWGYPGWWGPPVYYVIPEREGPTSAPARPALRPLQERMLRIAPVPLPQRTLPTPVRPLPSRDRGIVPLHRSDPPGSVPNRRPGSRPPPPQAVKPLPMPAPPVIRPPSMRTPEPQATPSPRPRRPWRRPGGDGE